MQTSHAELKIVIGKNIFQQEESFHKEISLKFEEKASKVLHLEYRFLRCCNLDASESRSEIAVKF
jgi:hypothetical protein